MTSNRGLALRVALGAWLFGWYCNAPGFWANFRDALHTPLEYDAFPSSLVDARVALAAYVVPALVGVGPLLPNRRVAIASAATLVVAAFVSLLSVQTGSDATFATSFWSGLWLLWFVSRSDLQDAPFLVHARALAHVVVGLMFLGAAVGKLTPEYWDGEAFFRLYFRDNRSWPYPWLRAELAPETFRGLATWFSRAAIAAELTLAASPLLPTRFVLGLAAATMLTMMAAWTFHLASVLSCLLGLLAAVWILERRLERPVTSSRTR
jgi:hypothetical protein